MRDANYYITSVTSAFTIFAYWQTAKHTYRIHERKKTISRLEDTDLVGVQDLIGRANKVNELVIVKVAQPICREKWGLRMGSR